MRAARRRAVQRLALGDGPKALLLALTSAGMLAACPSVRRESRGDAAPSAPIDSLAMPHDAAARFASFATSSSADAMGTPQASRIYVTDGLAQLSDAIDEVAAASEPLPVEVQLRAERLRAMLDSMRRDPNVVDSVPIVRSAFITAAGAVTALQREHYPHLDRATFQLRWAARRVSAHEPVRLQSHAVRRFFERASDALLAMAR